MCKGFVVDRRMYSYGFLFWVVYNIGMRKLLWLDLIKGKWKKYVIFWVFGEREINFDRIGGWRRNKRFCERGFWVDFKGEDEF